MTKKINRDFLKPHIDPESDFRVPFYRPGFLLKGALQQCRKIHSHNWEKHNLTAMQAAALMVLLDKGPVSQIVLGRAIDMEPSNIHGLVRRLESKKLITLNPDKVDARANVITLTPKGKKLAKLMFVYTDESDVRVMEPLNKQEQKTLYELLTRLIEYHRTAS